MNRKQAFEWLSGINLPYVLVNRQEMLEALSDITVDVYDDDGHRYDVPESLETAFHLAIRDINKCAIESDEWYYANEEFAEQFDQYRKK